MTCAPPVLAVTGAGGFLGQHVVSAAHALGLGVRPMVRRHTIAGPIIRGAFEMGELGQGPIAPTLLTGCTAVIHAAARAHVLQEHAANPLALFRRINTRGTIALAEAAVAAGVRRFVFVSSIGVLGNHSQGRPLTVLDPRAPVEDYAISKSEAEVALADVAARTGLEVVIIRPPLVHGPAAPGNFLRLLEGIAKGQSLPLGGAKNQRSYVGVSNLSEALIAAATVPFPSTVASGQNVSTVVCHVADDGVISTSRLIEVLAAGMDLKPKLINLPRWLVVGGAAMLGRGSMARRLFDDLEVDDSSFRRMFSWRPRIGLEDGLRLMASDFAHRQRNSG